MEAKENMLKDANANYQQQLKEKDTQNNSLQQEKDAVQVMLSTITEQAEKAQSQIDTLNSLI